MTSGLIREGFLSDRGGNKLKIVKHKKLDLYRNGFHVKSFESEKELDEFLENEYNTESSNWWNKEKDVKPIMNKRLYSVIESTYVTFE